MKWSKNQKNYFPYFDVLGHQKHPYVGRILKKSLQGSSQAQFYMAIKDPFGQFLLQPCTVSIKRGKNKFPFLRCSILVKASQAGTDAFWWAFTVWAFVAYISKCDCTHWRIHQTRCFTCAAINSHSGRHLQMAIDARKNTK